MDEEERKVHEAFMREAISMVIQFTILSAEKYAVFNFPYTSFFLIY